MGSIKDTEKEWIKQRENVRNKSNTSWVKNKFYSPNNRYVFFQSLQYTNPQLYDNVASYFGGKEHLFETKINKDKAESQKKIDEWEINYLNFIKTIADREAANEKLYLQKLFDQAKIDLTSEEYTKFYNALNQEKIDYPALIDLLNLSLQNRKLYQENLKTQINNLKLYEHNKEQLSKNARQELEQDFIESGKIQQYTNELRKPYEDNGVTVQYIKNWNAIITESINKSLREINITELITWLNNQNYKYTNEELEATLKDIIVAQAIEALESGQTSIQHLNTETLGKAVKEYKEKLYFNLYTSTQKLEKSIESIAKDTGENIYKTYMTYTKDIRAALTKQYTQFLPANKQQIFEDLLENAEKQAAENQDIAPNIKGRISKLFREAIQNAYKAYQTTNINATYKDFIENVSILNQVQNQIQKNLKISIIDNPATAEAVAQSLNPKVISENIFIPGKKIQLKNDIMFSVKFNSEDWVPKSIAEDTIEKAMNSMQKNFLEAYKIAGKGATEALTAYNTYINTIKNSTLNLNTADIMLEEQPQIYDLFFNSISVKEYEFYDNSLGFHGGSLGAGGRVEPVITNILKMYELGGISVPDAHFIIQAILNSGSDSVLTQTNPDLITTIKQYLVAGAALLMFDDGFSNFDSVLKEWETVFIKGQEPKTIHLYYLNNTYVPQSYLLYKLYESIGIFLTNIKADTASMPTARLEILNPINEQNVQNYFEKDDTSPQRWNIVSNLAQDTVTVEFLFMAGMLDLLEDLQKVFENPI